ncbi:CinA family protein [Candidatus Omnitrophota bacterium]
MSSSITSLSKKTGIILRTRKLTIAAAESCTGGVFSSILTDIPGSSDYFILGITAYSAYAKQKLLKVPRSTLGKHSTVSRPVTILMARNARKIAKADIGVGITGYAGPGGGTKQDPKGTVYIAVATGSRTRVKKYRFKGTRIQIKRKVVEQALILVQRVLRVTSSTS